MTPGYRQLQSYRASWIFFPYSQAHHPISLNNKRVHPGAEIMAQTGAQSSGATARGQNMIHTYTTQVNIHGRTL